MKTRKIQMKWLLAFLTIALFVGFGFAQRSKEDKNMTTKTDIQQTHKNRLANEQSPYLLQHANNPVDWYPWGDEAFETAKRLDKPIFLSIGYSTCHWCHVMEHESFEDVEVAKLMNEAFVCIKVDREERPDIDGVYMSVCQMLTGGGGWPLTIIMTPDKKPFFAGTYFPKTSRYGRAGMMELVPRISKLWSDKREALLADAEKITGALARMSQSTEVVELGEATLQLAYSQLASRYDTRHGGFSSAPKFPTPHNMLFLLRQWKRSGDVKALEMVEKTLTEMRWGGIYDHVGFGFHRYSTDERWHVPHFEKMLYDQAMIALACIETHQATGKRQYRRTAEEIFTYVLRDMTAPQGGFYSAEDADSEGVEGKFYLWSIEQLQEVLGKDDAKLASRYFNAEKDGNFRDESTGHKEGGNIFFINKSEKQLAKELETTDKKLAERIESICTKLFEAREERIHPYKDDKVLADWNGLMIAALAKGGRVFNEAKYIKAASKAAAFVLSDMRTDDKRLLHRHRNGQAGIKAHVDDYAFMIFALLELYQATFDVEFLKQALELNRVMMDSFWDDSACGFFFTADDAEQLLVRQKEIYDGAIPSGNSVAAHNLLRLARLTGDSDYEDRAAQLMQVFSGVVNNGPTAFTQLLQAVDFSTGPAYEVVVTGKPEDAKAMLRALNASYIPNMVVVFRPVDENASGITKIAPYTKALKPIDNKPTAYVCHNFACQKPTTDIDVMLQSLR
jgi:uncharacterized protein